MPSTAGLNTCPLTASQRGAADTVSQPPPVIHCHRQNATLNDLIPASVHPHSQGRAGEWSVRLRPPSRPRVPCPLNEQKAASPVPSSSPESSVSFRYLVSLLGFRFRRVTRSTLVMAELSIASLTASSPALCGPSPTHAFNSLHSLVEAEPTAHRLDVRE